MLNSDTVQKAIRSSAPLRFRIDSVSPASLAFLDRILDAYLLALGQEAIRGPLSYCLKEMISNGQKANAKRIYFEEHRLDVTAREDYEKGMKGFLKEVSENLDHYLRRLSDRKMSVSVSFHSVGHVLNLSVRNDVTISPLEFVRVKERVARSRSFESLPQLLESIVDQTEGAGLGIMMLIQFLKTIGLSEDAFKITTENSQTVASVTIPASCVRLDQVEDLGVFLARRIESLPHFPESVLRLIRLTEDVNARVSQIADLISGDPTLTADLLKQVNSSYYGLPSKVVSVLQAVKLIGMRSLHFLLFSFGFQRLLSQDYAKMKSLLEHSLQIASYAALLAREVKRKREIVDAAYAAGLLHHLGLIVLNSLTPQMRERMRKFAHEKKISVRVLEQFSFGMHHADVGALIAERWNLPDELLDAIKFHHDPSLASANTREVVYCVYLANAIRDLEKGVLSFGHLDRDVLEYFGLHTEQEMNETMSMLNKRMEKRLISGPTSRCDFPVPMGRLS